MWYESKIKYLEYQENGERVKGAGFVKIEVRGDVCNLHIHVNGVPREAYALGREDERTVVKLFLGETGREVEVTSLVLMDGRGSCELLSMQVGNLRGTGIAYENLSVLRIPLPYGGEIVSTLGKEGIMTVHSERQQSSVIEKTDHQECVVYSVAEVEDVPKTETRAAEYSAGEQKVSTGESVEPVQTKRNEDGMKSTETDYNVPGDDSIVKHTEQQTLQRSEQEITQMYENKWRQLSAIYPHITPFQDEREYLSLRPEDFVILSEKDFGLVHNSFLLHGYYNYRHLILQRMERRGEVKYYLGVPGNFYEREKQVAVMFGFESFECLEEPAGNGDYGYYMVPVEL